MNNEKCKRCGHTKEKHIYIELAKLAYGCEDIRWKCEEKDCMCKCSENDFED